jgi:hypothetical protein
MSCRLISFRFAKLDVMVCLLDAFVHSSMHGYGKQEHHDQVCAAAFEWRCPIELHHRNPVILHLRSVSYRLEYNWTELMPLKSMMQHQEACDIYVACWYHICISPLINVMLIDKHRFSFIHNVTASHSKHHAYIVGELQCSRIQCNALRCLVFYYTSMLFTPPNSIHYSTIQYNAIR